MSVRILVVEDEQHLAEGISENLQQEGYAVEIVGDGESALHRWRSGGIDLMILDVMLPDTDGFAICRTLRADRTHAAVPVIMLTGLKGKRF